MNDDLKMFAAKTQSRITAWLLIIFGGLMFALLIISTIPVHVDEKLLAILDRIITAMLPIVGTAVGFWMARQRDHGAPDAPPRPIATVPAAPPVIGDKQS